MNYKNPIFYLNTLALFFTNFFVIQAQVSDKPEIIEKLARSYKIVSLHNGDLLPFVNNHSGNFKYIYNNNKPVTIYEYRIRENDTLEVQQITYLGDTIQYTEKWDKIYRKLEREVLTFKDNRPLTQVYRKETDKDTFYANYYFWENNRLQKIMRYKENRFFEKVQYRYITPEMYLVQVYNADSNLIKYDTIIELYNADSSSRTIRFNNGAKQNYTIYEYSFDAFGNKTGMMVLYNRDSIGDHADFTSYQYKFKNIPPKPFHPKDLIGYWVGIDSYRYFRLFKNGTVEMSKLGKDFTQHSVWKYDPVSNVLSFPIPRTGNEKQETMVLQLQPEKMILKGEDWEFEKREVFIRPILPLIYKSNKQPNN